MSRVGRLAPTPSGHLHLGNALSFGACWLSARGPRDLPAGRVLLRIEDIDRGRSRPDIADSQRRDLEWLGLHWDEEVAPQSTRVYSTDGLPTYRCDCTRRERKARPCPHRDQPAETGAVRLRSALQPVPFVDRVFGPQRVAPDHDALLVRKSGDVGYPLAVVTDDHRDGVTEVVRGADLLHPTATQVELYRLRGWAEPTWLHAPLLLGADGRKLGKSHGSTELRALRAQGWTAGAVWRLLLPLLGCEADQIDHAVLDPARIPRHSFTVIEHSDRIRIEPAGPPIDW